MNRNGGGPPSERCHRYGYENSNDGSNYCYDRDDICGPLDWSGRPQRPVPCDDRCPYADDPVSPENPACKSPLETVAIHRYPPSRGIESRDGKDNGDVDRVVVVHGDCSEILREALTSCALTPVIATDACVIWFPSLATQPQAFPQHPPSTRRRPQICDRLSFPPTNRPEDQQ